MHIIDAYLLNNWNVIFNENESYMESTNGQRIPVNNYLDYAIKRGLVTKEEKLVDVWVKKGDDITTKKGLGTVYTIKY